MTVYDIQLDCECPHFRQMQTHLTAHYVSQGTLIYKFIKEIAFAREEHVRTEEMLGKNLPIGEIWVVPGRPPTNSTPRHITDLGIRTFKEREADTYEKLKIIDEEQLGKESVGKTNTYSFGCE